MMAEEPTATVLRPRGLVGDRACAISDSAGGRSATAKNPRKWPHLFDFRATFVEPPRSPTKLPAVRITLPDGTMVTSDQGDVDRILSKILTRDVTVGAAASGPVKAEEYWPDMEGLDH